MVYGVTASVAGVTVIFVLAWLSGLLRCYVRYHIVRQFGVDDYLALLSLFIFVVPAACYFTMIHQYGFDRPISFSGLNSLTQLIRAVELVWICELFYILGTGVIKLSFAFTLLRILVIRGQVKAVKIIIALLIITTITIFTILLFLCIPIGYAWNRLKDPFFLDQNLGIDPVSLGLKPKGKCLGVNTVNSSNYAHAAVMVFTDIALGIVFPIIVIRNLKMRRVLKITSCMMLGLGAMASCATIARSIYINATQKPTSSSSEENIAKWTGYLVLINPSIFWTLIEYGVCIIGANCSTLKPLISRALHPLENVSLQKLRPSKPSALSSPVAWPHSTATTRDVETADDKDSQKYELDDAHGARLQAERWREWRVSLPNRGMDQNGRTERDWYRMQESNDGTYTENDSQNTGYDHSLH